MTILSGRYTSLKKAYALMLEAIHQTGKVLSATQEYVVASTRSVPLYPFGALVKKRM